MPEPAQPVAVDGDRPPLPAKSSLKAGPAPAATATDRTTLIDPCRLAASVAILWMHTWQSAHRSTVGEVGRFGVPFFTATSFYLLMTSFDRRPGRRFPAYLWNRTLRLYVPFLAWAVLGLGAMAAKHRLVTHAPVSAGGAAFLLTGASFQLWFLPFLYLGSLLAFPFCRLAATLPIGHRRFAAVGLIAAAAAVVATPAPPVAPADSPWFQYSLFAAFSWGAIPSGLFGLATAMAVRRSDVSAAVGRLGLIAWCAATAALAVTARRDARLETAAGVGLLLFAISHRSGRSAQLWSRIAFLAYGIYLAQNLVLEFVQTVLGRLYVRPRAPVEVGVFLVALVATAGLSAALHRWRATRWMLG